MVSFHLTSAILFGEIFYAKVQRVSGRQVPLSLTVSGYYGSLPQIEDGLSAPVSLQYKAGRAGFCPYTRRLGIPFHPVHCLLALSVLFPLSILHKNHPPTRSRRASRKGKQENV